MFDYSTMISSPTLSSSPSPIMSSNSQLFEDDFQVNTTTSAAAAMSGDSGNIEEMSQEETILYIISQSLQPGSDSQAEGLVTASSSIDLIVYLQKLMPHYLNNWRDFGIQEKEDRDLLFNFNHFKEANNTVKNLVRSFISYMKKRCDSLIIECLDSEGDSAAQIQNHFIKFTTKQPINNTFLQRLVQSRRFGIQFQYYLRFYAFTWLAKSKINNKPAHLLVIFFLLRGFTNPFLIEDITSYKKE